MQSSVDTKSGRAYWFGAWTKEIKVAAELTPALFPVLVDLLFRKVLPQEIFSKTEVVDLKGRDRISIPEQGLSRARMPQGEELIDVCGKVVTQNKTGQSLALSEKFRLSLLSKFLAFEGQDHIKHELFMHSEGAVAELLALQAIGRLVPLELDALRVGLEFFEPKRIAMLGVSPVGTQRLFIRANAKEFNLEIEAENLGSKSELPLTRGGLIERLAWLLKELFDLALTA